MSTVSVIVPAYHSRYVAAALESVLTQTRTPEEIIVIDSSPETTLDQIRSYQERIRYLNEPARGVSHARNSGILAAQGDYIALLDADDLWLSDKIEKQLLALERFPQAVFSFSTTWNLVECEHPGIPRDPYRPPELLEWLRDRNGVAFGEVYELLLAANCVATSSVLVRKEAMLEAGLFDETINHGEDYDLWLRLARRYPAAFVCDPTSRYRVHPEGLSGSWEARSELFHEANIHILEKHVAAFPSDAASEALARAHADFARFQIKSARRHEAKNAALRSLRQRANLSAALLYIEAAFPRFYSFAARIAAGARPQ